MAAQPRGAGGALQDVPSDEVELIAAGNATASITCTHHTARLPEGASQRRESPHVDTRVSVS
jgi:hypothetical protein